MKKDKLIECVITLKNAMCGGGGIKGMDERVRDLEIEMKKHNRYMYLLIGGGFVILFLIEWFKK